MARDGEEAADRRRKRDTWIRLASSCKRAVARGLTVIPLLPDLYEEDYRVIALQGLAGTITDMADGSAAS